MLRQFHRPYVFGEPSLELLTAEMHARIDTRPPIRKGDLEALCNESHPGTVLILDGLFASELALNPTEIRQTMDAGWQVYGAASMGAIRAAELWPLGMIGLGDVYNLFRTGCLSSDADVAVLYVGPSFREVTLSMVHIRFLINHIRHRHGLRMPQARRMKLAAQRLYWTERSLARLLTTWRAMDIDENDLDVFSHLVDDPALHPKKRDGYYATATLLAQQWTDLYDLHADAADGTHDA